MRLSVRAEGAYQAYRPEAMLELLEILRQAGGPAGPEFLQTHPHAESRQQAIRELLAGDSR